MEEQDFSNLGADVLVGQIVTGQAIGCDVCVCVFFCAPIHPTLADDCREDAVTMRARHTEGNHPKCNLFSATLAPRNYRTRSAKYYTVVHNTQSRPKKGCKEWRVRFLSTHSIIRRRRSIVCAYARAPFVARAARGTRPKRDQIMAYECIWQIL